MAFLLEFLFFQNFNHFLTLTTDREEILSIDLFMVSS